MHTKGIIPNLSELIRYFNGKAQRLSDGSYRVPCPVHDDHNPSLDLSERDGKLLWHCHAGCPQEKVQEALLRLVGGHRGAETERRPAPSPSFTVDAYAQAKGLDAQKLREWGLTDLQGGGVEIPYRNDEGELHAVRYRLALEGANRFRWRKGDKPTLYGLWRLDDWELGSDLYLCEGETDTLTLWHAGLPALGIPGATAWKPECWRSLREFGRIFLIPIASPEFINEVHLHPTSHIGGTPMSGRKLTVDWKHTAEELYAYYNNTPNPQIARRFQALALLQRGRTLKETAAIVGVSIRAVQKWRTGFRTGGLDELTRRTRGGNRIPVRPRLTPDQQAQRIQHATTQGFRTLREAVAWCREALGVELSERPMRRVFEQLGFKRKVSRPMAVRADAALQAQWKQGGLARR